MINFKFSIVLPFLPLFPYTLENKQGLFSAFSYLWNSLHYNQLNQFTSFYLCYELQINI